MIKFALPNKGVLFEPTVDLLTSCGYRLNKSLRSLSLIDPENDIEFYFLRPGDIPLYVANGVLNVGITGKDFVAEKGHQPTHLIDLSYGHSKLRAAVRDAAPWKTLDEVAGLRIATSFPNITRRYFASRPIQITELEGAVEISVQLGIAEAVIDVVDTGATLDQAGLRIVGDPLFASCAALYAHPGHETDSHVQTIRSRIEGRMVAHTYMMVEYDCPQPILAAATALTPGLESPTITPLQREGWLSVKAMIKKREANRIMDELSHLGCRGILLTTIETARI
jgi:ATP phosphoribosyltransferase